MYDIKGFGRFLESAIGVTIGVGMLCLATNIVSDVQKSIDEDPLMSRIVDIFKRKEGSV